MWKRIPSISRGKELLSLGHGQRKKSIFFQKPKFFSDSLFRFLRVFCSLLGWWWVMKKGQLSQTFSDLGSGGPQFPGKFSRGIRGILDSRVFFIRRVYGQPREVSWDYKSLPLSLFVRKIIIKRRKRGEGWEGDAAFENQGHEEHPLLHRSWPCQSLKYKDCLPNKNRRKPLFKKISFFSHHISVAKRPACVLNYTHFLLFFAFLPQSVRFKEHLWTSVHTVPFCKMSQNFFVGSNLSQKSEKTAAIAEKLKRRGEKRK